MQIVIDIPNWLYNAIMEYKEPHYSKSLGDAVRDGIPLEQESKTGHCEECKHFRKLPLHADVLGKCVNHWGFCPKGDWYCADFEPQKGANE